MDEMTLKLYGVFGLTMFIAIGIVIAGLLINWVTDGDDYSLPWFITTIFFAATIACVLVF